MKLTEDQKDKIIRCLKVSKAQGGGQSLTILANQADEFNENVSKFLQSLKRKGLVTYFDTSKAWYWNQEVSINDIF